MNKSTIIVATLLASTAHATTAGNYAVSAEYTTYQAKADGDTTDLSGFAVGIDGTIAKNSGLFAKVSQTKDSNFNAKLTSFTGGYQHTLYNQNNAYLLGKVGLGYGLLDLDTLNANNDFFLFPISLEAGYKFTPKISIYANAGYQYASNMTSETTCQDGSQSSSAGQGTCSWHGGIAYYNDNVGNAKGTTFGIGAKYHF